VAEEQLQRWRRQQADAGQAIAVRDSKDALGPVLVFGQHAWRQFAAKMTTERLP
jgi:hypothetical protein